MSSIDSDYSQSEEDDDIKQADAQNNEWMQQFYSSLQKDDSEHDVAAVDHANGRNGDDYDDSDGDDSDSTDHDIPPPPTAPPSFSEDARAAPRKDDSVGSGDDEEDWENIKKPQPLRMHSEPGPGTLESMETPTRGVLDGMMNLPGRDTDRASTVLDAKSLHSTFDEAEEMVTAEGYAVNETLELVDTEKRYIRSLKMIVRSFRQRLVGMNELGSRRELISLADIENIFCNVIQILAVSKKLYDHFKVLQEEGIVALCKGCPDIMKSIAQELRVYNSYAANHHKATAELIRLRSKNEKLNDFLLMMEQAEGTTLSALLIAPVQRVPRYLLLLRSMLNHTSCATTKDRIDKALAAVESAASEMNQTVRLREQDDEVNQVQEELFKGKIQIAKDGRKFLKKGLFSVQNIQESNKSYSIFRSAGEKKQLLLMFNDMLLMVTPITLGPAKVKNLFLYHLMEVKKHDQMQAQTSVYLPPSTQSKTETELIADQWVRDLSKLCAECKALETHRLENEQDALASIQGGRTRADSYSCTKGPNTESTVWKINPTTTALPSSKDALERQTSVRKTTGWLKKRGNGIRTWKRRYFVLDDESKVLRYYKDPISAANSDDATGYIDVEDNVALVDNENRWGEFGFDVFPATSTRSYALVAESEEDRTRWITALQRHATVDRIQEGFLRKKGGPTGWKTRYFVCLERTRQLFYFKSPSDSAGSGFEANALGHISIDDVSIRESSASAKRSFNKGEFVFEIHRIPRRDHHRMSTGMDRSTKPDKTYVLAANDLNEMKKWIRTLTHLASWQSGGVPSTIEDAPRYETI